MHQHLDGQRSGSTGLAWHSDCLGHDPGPWHPDSPERLRAVMAHLDMTGQHAELATVPPRYAEPGWMASVHVPVYVAQVEAACRLAKDAHMLLDHETPVSRGSWDAIRAATGAALSATDRVMAGEVKNAFCLVRPPGHHATPRQAMGFCIINHVAVAARYLQRHHGLGRVAIIDFDVHHGNGTQAAFWTDPTVLYASMHQYPLYPGSGAASERGAGEGEGTVLNCPLAAGEGDKAFQDALESTIVPAVETFRPDFVLVSAGFDAHHADPLGSMAVTEQGFFQLTRTIRELADAACGGRLVTVLEGGYDLDALPGCVAAHLAALQGKAGI